ncbi:MAG TPA: DUF2007 domain-containing protein [Allosphingosinicella sp.]|nr:DUF2007 domain-containing protein [Allosphingosinicella sp.]
MALVEIARFDNRVSADIVRSRLAAEGVDAILFDEGLASLGIGSLTPVRLMVDEDEEGAAQALLNDLPQLWR